MAKGIVTTNNLFCIDAKPAVEKKPSCKDSTKALQHRTRTLVLLFFLGAASGWITIWVFNRNFPPVLDAGGIIFLAFLAFGLLLARSLMWMTVDYSPVRCIVASILISLGHPLILLGQQFTSMLTGYSCRLSANSWSYRFLPCGDWLDFFVIALPVLIVSLSLFSSAVWVLTRRWSIKEFSLVALLIVAAIGSSLSLTLLLEDTGNPIRMNHSDVTFFVTLAVIGEAGLGALFAKQVVT